MIILNDQKVEFETFPNGETKLVEDSIKCYAEYFNNFISFKYGNDSDLIKLMLVKQYLDDIEEFAELTIYYMPYSRMDRSENGSAFTLKYIADFINKLNFEKVKVVEPHSDVTPALLNKVEPIYINFDLLPKVMEEVGFDKDNDYLFFPDSGAQKRYHSLKGYKQLVGYKHRDFETGEIKSLEVVGEIPEKPNKIIIVDDLSSYGGTFLHSGLKLKELGFKEVYLLVAHCENSIFKGKLLKEDSPITKIFTTDTILTLGTNKIKTYKIEELLNN